MALQDVLASDKPDEGRTKINANDQELAGRLTAVESGKSAVGHTHDDRYFTETEANANFVGIARAIPPGGTTGQVLAKSTNTDYSVSWQNQSGGGGAAITVQDEASSLTQRSTVNFTGAGVTAADDAVNGRTNVTIPGSSLTVQDEGSSLTQRNTVNFTGSGVSAADNSGASRTDVTINSGVTTVQDEGTGLTARNIINFTGGGVTAVDNSGSGRTDVTIPANPTLIKDLVLYNGKTTITNTDETGRYPVVDAGTITRIVAQIETAPTGAALNITVKKNGSSAHTMNIAAGTNTTNSTGLSIAAADGDYFTFAVTQVGSSVAGGKLTVLLREALS